MSRKLEWNQQLTAVSKLPLARTAHTTHNLVLSDKSRHRTLSMNWRDGVWYGDISLDISLLIRRPVQ